MTYQFLSLAFKLVVDDAHSRPARAIGYRIEA